MLPLAGSAVPSTAEELARALDSGLRGCGLISREVTGDERRLAIDLTGAEASRATRLPVGRERIGPGPEIAEFASRPIHSWLLVVQNALRCSTGFFEPEPIPTTKPQIRPTSRSSRSTPTVC